MKVFVDLTGGSAEIIQMRRPINQVDLIMLKKGENTKKISQALSRAIKDTTDVNTLRHQVTLEI